jgi:hypothetical protein
MFEGAKMREPLIRLPGTGAHAHRLVAKTAMEMAQEVYEKNAGKSNDFYAKYPDRLAYVKECWALYLDAARTTLAQLLSTNIDDVLKDQIHDALIKDATLRRGREGVLQMKKGAGA